MCGGGSDAWSLNREQVSHPGQQHRRGKGLLEKLGAGGQGAAQVECFAGVSRHEQDPQFGSQGEQLGGQCGAAHPRHDNIGEQQIDGSIEGLTQLRTGLPRFRKEDGEARPAQCPGDEVAHQ